MRFSYSETERFFREIFPTTLSAGQIQELTRHMEGWVGALQLFGLSLRGKETTVDAMNGVLKLACEEAADYLVHEVVDIQPERVRRFINATALLERFNAELCEEVTALPDAREMLDHACRNNLFIVPLDSVGIWYRYHHLFSKAVRNRARMSFPDACRHIYRRGALWFASRGYLEDAFRHAFASEDMEFAADMLEDNLMALYERYEIASFRRWLNKLPRDMFAGRALLRLYDCRFKIESVQLSDVSAVLGEIEGSRAEAFGRYGAAKKKLCEDLLLVFARILPHWFDPENADIEESQEALCQISRENRALSAFRTTIPFSYFYKGEMRLAAQELRKASAAVLSSGSSPAAGIWFRVAASVERFQGRLNGSEAVLKDDLSFWTRRLLRLSSEIHARPAEQHGYSLSATASRKHWSTQRPCCDASNRPGSFTKSRTFSICSLRFT